MQRGIGCRRDEDDERLGVTKRIRCRDGMQRVFQVPILLGMSYRVA